MKVELKRSAPLRGEVIIPPDKSISHRAVMFSSMAQGKSIIKNPLLAEDTISTMNIFRELGATMQESNGALLIEGSAKLSAPAHTLDCGNSGTTMRLVSGVLAGQTFDSTLFGDSSLSKRPMGRVMAPLRKMGADITAYRDDSYPPLTIKGG